MRKSRLRIRGIRIHAVKEADVLEYVFGPPMRNGSKIDYGHVQVALTAAPDFTFFLFLFRSTCSIYTFCYRFSRC